MGAPRSSQGLRVVVGGGIGSGKTTVARIMGGLGAAVIVADEVGHQVLERGGEAFRAVAKAWPEVVVAGEIDRGALATIVFSDDRQLDRLEAITHPAIATRIRELAAAVDGDLVLETPVQAVAGEPGWVRVFVDAAPGVRLRRAVVRGGDPDDVIRRMAAQLDRDAWLQWAHRVIVNDGSIEDLEEKVEELWRSLH